MYIGRLSLKERIMRRKKMWVDFPFKEKEEGVGELSLYEWVRRSRRVWVGT